MKAYEQDGYFLARGLLTCAEVGAFLEWLDAYVCGKRPAPDGIRIQVEPSVARGEVIAGSPAGAVRKVEDLVQHDELFRSLALKPSLVAIMQSLLGPNLK